MAIDDPLDIFPIDPLQPDEEFADAGLLIPPLVNFAGAGTVDSGMAENRVDKHERPKGQVAARLRKMGLRVSTALSASSYDLLVNDRIRVTLRVAYPGLRRHRVTVGGRSYRYRYETWHFNFHHHGRLGDQYTDFFTCIATNPKRGEQDRIFVIPWQQVTGKTFSLHCGKSDYRGRYAPFLGAWGGVADAAGRAAKGLLQVA